MTPAALACRRPAGLMEPITGRRVSGSSNPGGRGGRAVALAREMCPTEYLCTPHDEAGFFCATNSLSWSRASVLKGKGIAGPAK
jgi:hypothetical protein